MSACDNVSAGPSMMQNARMESVGRGGFRGGFVAENAQSQEFASMMQGAREGGRSGGCGRGRGPSEDASIQRMTPQEMEDFLKTNLNTGNNAQNTNRTVSSGPSNVTPGNSVTPSSGNSPLQLGNTSININGGTAEQRAKVEENFTSMYNSNSAFKNVIDSKANSGIDLDFKEFSNNIAGMASVGGNHMTMDIGFMNDGGREIMAEVIAHEVGHLAGMNHGPALDNFAKSAGSSIA